MKDFDWKAPDYNAVYTERAKRVERMRSGKVDVGAVREYYKSHPVDFINDFGMTFDPRLVELGLPAVVPFIMFPRQAEFIDWAVERWKGREDGLVEKSRDMGVSWLCVALSVWMWLYHPGAVIGFGSRKEDLVDRIGDPDSLFWKIRSFISLLPLELRPHGYDEQKHAPHMRIINPENGSIIRGEAGDNIGRGGRTSVYFIDEAAFIERADSVDAALSQTSNCRIYVSTPNGAGNPFYRKRHGGRVKVFVFDWKQDKRKDAAWYQRMKDTLDPVVLAQEVDRDYTASVANAYVPGAIVTQAQMRGPMEVIAMGPVQVGVDPARFGDDKSVITFRQGRMVYPQIAFGKVDLVDCAGRVSDAIRVWPERVSQIAVDTIGVGAGVADILRRTFGDMVVDVNSSTRLSDGQNYNLRARMWRDMLAWVKAGASLPNDSELYTDLTALQYGYRGGELLMESKDDAKKRGIRSPDRADSLALTFATPVKEPERNVIPGAEHGAWRVFDEVAGY